MTLVLHFMILSDDQTKIKLNLTQPDDFAKRNTWISDHNTLIPREANLSIARASSRSKSRSLKDSKKNCIRIQFDKSRERDS